MRTALWRLRLMLGGALLLAGVAACTQGASSGSPPETRPATTGTAPRTPTSSSPASTHQRPERLPDVHLTVDWQRRPKRWPTVLTIPWGTGGNQLGIDHIGGQDPIVPTSFLVTDKGFWIVDPANDRLMLFGWKGRVLQRVHGISQVTTDIGRMPDGTLITIDYEPHDSVKVIRDGRVVRTQRLGDHIYRFAQAPSALGVVESLPWRMAQVSWQTHEIRSGPRVASSRLILDNGAILGVRSRDRAGSVQEVAYDPRWRRQFHLTGKSGPRQVVCSWEQDVSTYQGRVDLGIYMGSFTENPVAGGLYYLSLTPAGEVRAFEKIDGPGRTINTNQVSYLAVGPGGRVYQLWIGKDHVEVRRRPLG